MSLRSQKFQALQTQSYYQAPKYNRRGSNLVLHCRMVHKSHKQEWTVLQDTVGHIHRGK